MDLKRLKKKLKKLGEIGNEVSEKALDRTAQNIVNDAKLLAPVSSGDLRASILYLRKTGVRFIGPTADHGIFVEFQTGGAKRKGDGSAKEAIYRWCHLHGIENPYPVYKKIMESGTKAKPFLIPAFDKGKTKLYKNMEKEYNRAVSKSR